MFLLRVVSVASAATLAGLSLPAWAATVPGGGNPGTDCALVLEIPGANKPAPPKAPKAIDCVDGDPACDEDGLRNGECVFPVELCVNSSLVPGCEGDEVVSITVDHAIDDGRDRRFDFDFQALQSRVGMLGLPSGSPDQCATESTVTVRLKGPDSSNVMKKNKKSLRITAEGTTAAGAASDVDKVKFTCQPEGDGVYLPVDLYEGTFDRIATQVFAQSCALAGCHDSESQAGSLILLSNSAYGNLVGVTPGNAAAAIDGLDRVTPGDADLSFLYRKLVDDLEPGYGDSMPLTGADLSPELIEIIRLWILGDMTLGAAPETGWVVGTDQ